MILTTGRFGQRLALLYGNKEPRRNGPGAESDEYVDQSLGDRLRKARLSLKLTQHAAGELVGVEPNTIARYEAGRIKPSSTALFALSQIYERPMEWFLGEPGDSEDQPSDPTYEVDLELVMNEASLALRQVSDRLSPEAIKSIADYIRFVDEREEREGREGEAQG